MPSSSGALDVNGGNAFAPSQASSQPSVSWAGDASKLYTLVMSDPDAPSHSNPRCGEWRHWIVVNVRGSDLSTGDVLTQYAGPTPPEGTGPHRYVFALFEQAGRLEGVQLPESRCGFKARDFAEQHGLRPVACNFFSAQASASEPQR
eukprot:tig00020943_g16322.t1